MASMKAKWTPRPVPGGVYGGRSWQTDPNCLWCRVDGGIYFAKRVSYDFLWRHMTKATLTLLCDIPYVPYVEFTPVEEEITGVLANIHATSIPSLFVPFIRQLAMGERIDPPYAQMILTAIRREHFYLGMELFESYIFGGTPNPHYRDSYAAWRVIIAAAECAAYRPELLTKLGCRRLPIIPPAAGHFMYAFGTGELWKEYLSGRFGVEVDADDRTDDNSNREV